MSLPFLTHCSTFSGRQTVTVPYTANYYYTPILSFVNGAKMVFPDSFSAVGENAHIAKVSHISCHTPSSCSVMRRQSQEATKARFCSGVFNAPAFSFFCRSVT